MIKTGQWSWGGMSADAVWAKYEKEVGEEYPRLDAAARRTIVCERVLMKATKTDARIDRLAGITHKPRVRRAWSLLLLLRALPFAGRASDGASRSNATATAAAADDSDMHHGGGACEDAQQPQPRDK